MTPKKLRLFVYGTLKRGYANHERYCRGVRSVEEASLPGRLYQLPAGYPGLMIPEECILAHATAEPQRDLELPAEFAGREPQHQPAGDARGSAGWPAAFGEILTFGNPLARLRAIDRLEGCSPGWPSLYLRVLAPVVASVRRAAAPTWLYIMPDADRKGHLLRSGRWPG